MGGEVGFLFNSLTFIFLFLPVSVFGFYLTRSNKKWNLIFLLSVSVIFYGFWDLRSIPILFSSILFNYFIGNIVNVKKSRLILASGISINVAVLICTKYYLLLVAPLVDLFNQYLNLQLSPISSFPVGISFFTFTQIGYLVNRYHGSREKSNVIEYFNFVTYFPHLIAGPILDYKNFHPQILRIYGKDRKDVRTNFYLGFEVFVFGMAKKVLVADKIGVQVDAFFAQESKTGTFASLSASYLWIMVIGYSLQLYFDFSAYSEMAWGLSKMLGIDIPINFMKPYLSTNLIEFWRKWHISLSNFLRDFIYIPLGGNRKGKFSRYTNLLITMIIGGLWHGSNWTFAIWGLCHGILLMASHMLQKINLLSGWKFGQSVSVKCLQYCSTFLLVSLLWVLFRSPNLDFAMNVYMGLFTNPLNGTPINPISVGLIIVGLMIIVFEKTIPQRIHQHTNGKRNLFVGATFGLTVFFLNQPSSYLYAQF
jgi:D-alanyl-lipoteichoic acid acyltransferase DltB (MBOAT superfamily)